MSFVACCDCIHWEEACRGLGKCGMATMPETVVMIHVKIRMPNATLEEAKKALEEAQITFFTPPDFACNQFEAR